MKKQTNAEIIKNSQSLIDRIDAHLNKVERDKNIVSNKGGIVTYKDGSRAVPMENRNVSERAKKNVMPTPGSIAARAVKIAVTDLKNRL